VVFERKKEKEGKKYTPRMRNRRMVSGGNVND
jgi:ribosomal protein S30